MRWPGQHPRGHALGPILPNALSAIRILCAGLFPFATVEGRLALIVIAAISDGLDGLLARALGGATWWGGLFDAGADKVFAVTVVVDLLVRGELAWWQMLLLLARDVVVMLILATAALMRRWDRIKAAAPGMLGKLTTVALFVLLLALVGWPGWTAVTQPLLVVAMSLSVLAGLDYVRGVWRSLRGAAG